MSINIGGIKIPEMTYPVLTSNSTYYIDTGFLEDYVEVMGLDSTFPAAGVEDALKQSAVYRAQVYIESLPFVGFKSEPYDQILQWDRDGVYDVNGVAVDSDQTPYDIFNAVAEAAYLEYGTIGILQPKIIPTDLMPKTGQEVRAGSVGSKTTYDTSQLSQALKNKVGADLYVRLKSYLDNWITSGGINMVKLARA